GLRAHAQSLRHRGRFARKKITISSQNRSAQSCLATIGTEGCDSSNGLLIRPRLRADIARCMAEAARLRRQYGIDVGSQRAPFFELQTEDFALLAIDTGVLRTVDERQWGWIERALDRSRGKFIGA